MKSLRRVCWIQRGPLLGYSFGPLQCWWGREFVFQAPEHLGNSNMFSESIWEECCNLRRVMWFWRAILSYVGPKNELLTDLVPTLDTSDPCVPKRFCSDERELVKPCGGLLISLFPHSMCEDLLIAFASVTSPSITRAASCWSASISCRVINLLVARFLCVLTENWRSASRALPSLTRLLKASKHLSQYVSKIWGK